MDDVPAFALVDEAHLDEAGKMLKRFLGTILTDVEAVSKRFSGRGTPDDARRTVKYGFLSGAVLGIHPPAAAFKEKQTPQARRGPARHPTKEARCATRVGCIYTVSCALKRSLLTLPRACSGRGRGRCRRGWAS